RVRVAQQVEHAQGLPLGHIQSIAVRTRCLPLRSIRDPFSFVQIADSQAGSSMARPVRRVVTGHNPAGKSIFIVDDVSQHVYERSPGSAIVTELWETTASPANNRGNEDAIKRDFRLPPPKTGSVFRVIEYPPDKERLKALATELAEPDDGSGRVA